MADEKSRDGSHSHSGEAEQGRRTPMREFSRSLPMSLLRAREAVMRQFRPSLRNHGLTEQQWRILRALTAVDTIEVTELAQSWLSIVAIGEQRAFERDDGDAFIFECAQQPNQLCPQRQVAVSTAKCTLTKMAEHGLELRSRLRLIRQPSVHVAGNAVVHGHVEESAPMAVRPRA